MHPSRRLRRSIGFVSLILLTACARVQGQFPTTHPYAGITYVHETHTDPPQSIYVVIVDLSDPNVGLHVARGGPDPDGPGEWQTTLMPVREIAQREAFDVAINASYFEITRPKGAGEIAEEKSERAGAPVTTAPTTSVGYRAGVWSKTVGWAMSDGELFSPKPRADWPAFWIDANARAHLGDLKDVPPDARQMVQGNVWLVRDGKPVEPKGNAKVRHPRTIVGLDRSGTKLVLLTVDGRRPGTATGMNGAEMSTEVLHLGCTDAINLDGGGSTTLVMRDPSDHQLKTINQPSDLRERPVADVIGISVKEDFDRREQR